MPVRGLFMGLCPKPRTPAFLSEKSGAKELNFSCFTLSFRAGIYGTKTGMVSRNIYFALISLLSANIAAVLRRPRNCSGASPPANIAAALRRPGAFYGALPQTPHAFLKKAWEK